MHILADECENCGRAAYAFRTECDNSYCQACITMRHKVIHRRRHTITRLSVMNKADHSTVVEDKPIIIDGMCHLYICWLFVVVGSDITILISSEILVRTYCLSFSRSVRNTAHWQAGEALSIQPTKRLAT